MIINNPHIKEIETLSKAHSILDWIKMSNGDTLVGVVDFSNEKFIHFYNFDLIEDDPSCIIAAIVWKAKYHTMRFSVFCALHYPQLKIPRVNLVNRRGVKDMSEISHPGSQSKRMTFSVKEV